MKTFLISLLLLVLVAVGGGGYVLIYSDLPVKFAKPLLEKAGCQVTGLEGSLHQGITLSSLKCANHADAIDIEQAKIHSKNAVTSLLTGVLHIDELSAQKVLLASNPKIPTLGLALLPELLIDKLRLKQVTIKTTVPLAGALVFNISNFAADGLSFNPKSTAFKLEGFVLTSDAVEVTAPSFSFVEKKLSFSAPMAVRIPHASYQEQLRKDITALITLSYSLGVFGVDLRALDDKLKINFESPMMLTVSIDEINPQEWYLLDLPVTELKLKLQLQGSLEQLQPQYTGSLKFGIHTFQLEIPTERGPGLPFVKAKGSVGNTEYVFSKGSGPWQLSATPRQTLYRALSTLAFSKDYPDLNAEERTQVDAWRTHFQQETPPAFDFKCSTTPVIVRGKPKGLQFVQAPQTGPLAELKLRTGDILLSIDTISFTDPKRAQAYLQALTSDAIFKLKIERNRRPLFLSNKGMWAAAALGHCFYVK